MTSFNKVILLGNLTRDPEVRYTPNTGTCVATFSIAVNEKYRQGDETKETVSYVDIVVYGKPAENCGKYIFKGDSVLIDGKIRQRRWEDKDTGAKRSKIEVIAGPQGVTFMPKRQAQGSGGRGPSDVPSAVGDAFPDAEPVGEGDIPF